MLNSEALLLKTAKDSDGGGTVVPFFTVDLTDVSDSKLGENSFFCYNGGFNTVVAERSISIENSWLDYVDMQSTLVLELYVGKTQQNKPTLEMTNVDYWTETAASSSNFWTSYFYPLDLSKDALLKVSY